MLEVSKRFKKAIYSPSRKCKAKIRFEILDVDAFKDSSSSVSDESIISRKNQLTNKIREKTNNYLSLEKDYVKLDSSFVIPPLLGELPDEELGWWSNNLCDENGIFTINPTVEFTFTKEHSSGGLTLYFDINSDEYATDFDIEVFNSADEIIAQTSIIGNNLSTYVYMEPLTNYKRILITLKKWSKGYRRAKMVEVDFGVIREYEDDKLIKLNVLQEIDLISSKLPASEFKFTVDNSNRDFNILNPEGFYAYLQEGQECFVDIGVELEEGLEEYEYVQVGKYYLKKSQSDEGTLTATFTARDIIDILSNVETENTVSNLTTLYDLAENFMLSNGIDKYVISNNLKEISTKGLYKKMSNRNLLQLIAIAGMCVVYTDNLGVLHLRQLLGVEDVIESVDVSDTEVIGTKNQIINNILDPSFKVASFEKDRFSLDSSFTISEENISEYELGWWSSELSNDVGNFDTPLEITITTSREHGSTNFEIIFDTLSKEYATNLNIKAYDVSGSLVLEENIINTQTKLKYSNNLLANSRKIVITLNKWSQPIRRARVAEIGFDLPVDNITFDNIYKEPQIELDPGVKQVEITYYPTDLNSKATLVVTNDRKDGAIFKLDNSLINTEQDALNVANWIMKESNSRANFKVDWRQNPALTLADRVSIENGYGTNNTANITKQVLDYQGYLSGKTEAKGVV